MCYVNQGGTLLFLVCFAHKLKGKGSTFREVASTKQFHETDPVPRDVFLLLIMGSNKKNLFVFQYKNAPWAYLPNLFLYLTMS